MQDPHVRITHVALEPVDESVTEAQAKGAAAGFAIANSADALLAYRGKGYLCRHAALSAVIEEVAPAVVEAVTKG